MTTLLIQPWRDPVIDTIGWDPRSLYVEKFWLPTIGPTSVLLLRHLATRFDEQSEGVELRLASTSKALGVGSGEGHSSPIARTLRRLAQFDLACDDGETRVAVRRNLPPAQPRHVRRFPPELRAEFVHWAHREPDDDTFEAARRAARRLASTLLVEDQERDHVERVLYATGFHPSLCHDAVRWAHEHRAELAFAPERDGTTLPADAPGAA